MALPGISHAQYKYSIDLHDQTKSHVRYSHKQTIDERMLASNAKMLNRKLSVSEAFEQRNYNKQTLETKHRMNEGRCKAEQYNEHRRHKRKFMLAYHKYFHRHT